jgi:hypothetical protein
MNTHVVNIVMGIVVEISAVALLMLIAYGISVLGMWVF